VPTPPYIVEAPFHPGKTFCRAFPVVPFFRDHPGFFSFSDQDVWTDSRGRFLFFEKGVLFWSPTINRPSLLLPWLRARLLECCFFLPPPFFLDSPLLKVETTPWREDKAPFLEVRVSPLSTFFSPPFPFHLFFFFFFFLSVRAVFPSCKGTGMTFGGRDFSFERPFPSTGRLTSPNFLWWVDMARFFRNSKRKSRLPF